VRQGREGCLKALYLSINGVCTQVYASASFLLVFFLSVYLFFLHLGCPFIGRELGLGFALIEVVSS
jgi:hypothetical protein